MKEFKELINQTNSNRIKTFYSLVQLQEITGMSARALKYRMLVVKKKYEGVESLLFKKNGTWNIHSTIVDEFQPKYQLKNKTIYTHNWVSMATWNPKFNYDIDYHKQIIIEIKEQLPTNHFAYTIELDGRGVNHTHIISDATTTTLNLIVTSTIGKYIEQTNDVRIQIEQINNKYSTIEYLKKASQLSGVL